MLDAIALRPFPSRTPEHQTFKPLDLKARAADIVSSPDAVVRHIVHRASMRRRRDDVSGSYRLNKATHFPTETSKPLSIERSGKPSDVRAGHGGTAESRSGAVATDPSAENANARSPDVQACPVVGEGGRRIPAVDGAYGAS